MNAPIAWLEPETAPRWRPNHLRGECPICNRRHRFCYEGRKQCYGRDYVAFTRETFLVVVRAVLEQHRTPQ